jgi:hypothetical protein
MKVLFSILLLGLFPGSAHANSHLRVLNEVRSRLPQEVQCRLLEAEKFTDVTPAEFELTGLRQGDVSASLYDQNFLGGEMDWTSVTLEFSNECDNMYTLILSGAELMALEEGRMAFVRGFIHYTHADGADLSSGFECVKR